MFFLFDIGGTKMRFAISKNGERIDGMKVVPMPAKNFNAGIKILGESARELSGGKKILAVAGGIAGPFDKRKTKVIRAPNISGWNNKPLKKELERALKAPVCLENDAAVAALGEAVFGAGKKQNVVAYITIGTGVGGARVVRKNIDVNSIGFEPGHQIIDADSNAVCPCGARGHLESYLSNAAIKKRYGKNISEITAPAIWDGFAKWLAYGLNNVIVFWSPDIIILGGGTILNSPSISLERTRYYLTRLHCVFPKLPKITKASLGDSAGLYGALSLIKQQYDNGKKS